MGALEKAVPIATLVFVVSSMVAMGLGLKVAQITAPLRNLRLVSLSLLAKFVLMPAAAMALARVLRLDEPLGVGLLVLGVAAGAPFLPKLTQIAKGNLAFAVALMVLLMVITVGYLPLVLPILLPGVSVNPAKIARSLVLLMLVPLAVALAVNAKLPAAAARANHSSIGFPASASFSWSYCSSWSTSTRCCRSSAPAPSWPACCSSRSVMPSAGRSAAQRQTHGPSWAWARRNATLPRRSWWAAKASATLVSSSWWSSSRSSVS